MKRTQFTIAGEHPLLIPVYDYLIKQGYAFVNVWEIDESQPVFVVAGNTYSFSMLSVMADSCKKYPVLLLSSSCVYSDRNQNLELLDPVPMDEAQGHVIASPLDPKTFEILVALATETFFTQRSEGKTIVVRPFNVYGPHIKEGVIPLFFDQAKQGLPLQVHSPGRQTRTFLYEEDFFAAVGSLVQRLLRGCRGIYNVGSTEQVEVLSLAKSIGHALGKEVNIELVNSNFKHLWWKLPALTRITADARWSSRTSLRSGLFRMVQDVHD